MSEQVTNVDIDDVLSSIRRLVSEGGQKSSKDLNEADHGAPVSEKLILTPNFRVKDSQDTKSAPPADDAPVDQPDVPLFASEDPGDIALVLKPEQSIPDGESLVDFSRTTLEATIAELEAQVGEKGEDWEPDGSESPQEVTWASAGFVAATREPAKADQEDTTVDVAVEENEDAGDMDTVASTLASTLVAESLRETVDAPNETEDASDIPQSFVAHPRAHRWSQEAERRLTPIVEEDTDFGDELAHPAQVSNDDQLEKYLNQGAMFDEATLKRVVQEVVREELQGNLGERITRNVRKLVRREIHNILTTQEFE